MVDFKGLKEKVGIDDIAYSLGYRINRKAGVGTYLRQSSMATMFSSNEVSGLVRNKFSSPLSMK